MVGDGPIERSIQAALSSPERGLNESKQSSPEPTAETAQKTPTSDKRKLHKLQVVKISDRCEVVKWIGEEFERHGRKNLMMKTVRRNPQYFKGSINANLSKALSWWK